MKQAGRTPSTPGTKRVRQLADEYLSQTEETFAEWAVLLDSGTREQVRNRVKYLQGRTTRTPCTLEPLRELEEAPSKRARKEVALPVLQRDDGDFPLLQRDDDSVAPVALSFGDAAGERLPEPVEDLDKHLPTLEEKPSGPDGYGPARGRPGCSARTGPYQVQPPKKKALDSEAADLANWLTPEEQQQVLEGVAKLLGRDAEAELVMTADAMVEAMGLAFAYERRAKGLKSLITQEDREARKSSLMDLASPAVEPVAVAFVAGCRFYMAPASSASSRPLVGATRSPAPWEMACPTAASLTRAVRVTAAVMTIIRTTVKTVVTQQRPPQALQQNRLYAAAAPPGGAARDRAMSSVAATMGDHYVPRDRCLAYIPAPAEPRNQAKPEQVPLLNLSKMKDVGAPKCTVYKCAGDLHRLRVVGTACEKCGEDMEWRCSMEHKLCSMCVFTSTPAPWVLSKLGKTVSEWRAST